MKITIAYLPDFEPLARALVTTIRYMIPGIKVRESDRHAPYRHLYLTTRKHQTDTPIIESVPESLK